MRRNISRWGGLRARLLMLMQAKRGQQAALARELGVPRQAVNNWVTGSVSPNAETTLRLLEFIEEAEAKQKQSAGASTPARRTRKSKSTRNEKAKSSQTAK